MIEDERARRMKIFRPLSLVPAAFAALACFAASPNLVPNPAFTPLPNGSPESWTFASPRPALAPEAKLIQQPGGNQLLLRGVRPSAFGNWSTWVRAGLKPGATYRFSIDYSQEKVETDTNAAVILSWYRDTEGTKLIRRDYAEPTEDGQRQSFERTLEAPAAVQSLKLELCLRWTAGSLLWKNPVLTEVLSLEHRRVRVVTTRLRIDGPTTVEQNVQRIAQLFDRAGREKPDLVLFAEILAQYGVSRPVTEIAQPIPGPISEMLSAKARQYKTYAATSILESVGPLIYNTAVLIDREGRIAGKYRKVHLPLSEGEAGYTPGSEYPVFPTDFGKVGMLICWDHWFPEAARILRLKGAEMILVPIMGEGEPHHWDVISRARAIDNGVYLVSAMTQDWPSRIVDPKGEVLAETSARFGVALAEVDLDRQDGVYWMSIGPGMGEPKSLYIRERRPETYGEIR